jgi:hypothetical protein
MLTHGGSVAHTRGAPTLPTLTDLAFRLLFNLPGRMDMLLLLIVLILLIGVLPTWPYSSGWGYYPSSGLGAVLLVLVVLALLGRV